MKQNITSQLRHCDYPECTEYFEMDTPDQRYCEWHDPRLTLNQEDDTENADS